MRSSEATASANLAEAEETSYLLSLCPQLRLRIIHFFPLTAIRLGELGLNRRSVRFFFKNVEPFHIEA